MPKCTVLSVRLNPLPERAIWEVREAVTGETYEREREFEYCVPEPYTETADGETYCTPDELVIVKTGVYVPPEAYACVMARLCWPCAYTCTGAVFTLLSPHDAETVRYELF
jgi:hypothetical protein